MTKARDLANAGTALSAVSATELAYLDGVTSAVQTQIDTKLASTTASSTYQPLVSGVDDTEIGYLNGVTSAVQTQLDAKIANTLTTTTGDIIYASAANTPARRGIGSTGQVLTVAGGVPTWANASASTTSYTLLSTTNLAGASSTTVSGLSGYNKLFGAVYNSVASNAGVEVKLRPNNDTAANYFWATGTVRGASSWAATNVSGSGNFVNQSEIDLGGYGSTAASGDLNAYFAIDGANSSGKKMITYATGTAGGSGNNHRNYTGWTIYNGTSVISSVNVRITGGTFNAGTLYIWGAN